MTKLQLFIYIAFLLLDVLGVATIVEFYKKGIRKDKANIWEIRAVALILTIINIAVLPLMNLFHPVLGLIGAPLWADFALYTILFFVLQMQADMKLIKKAFASIVKEKLKKAGLTDEQIENILAGIKLS